MYLLNFQCHVSQRTICSADSGMQVNVSALLSVSCEPTYLLRLQCHVNDAMCMRVVGLFIYLSKFVLVTNQIRPVMLI